MIHSAWKPMVLLVVLAAVVTGCCDAEKAEISSLTHQNEVQMQQINDFKDEVNVLHKDNEQLKKDAEDKAIALVKKHEMTASLAFLQETTTRVLSILCILAGLAAVQKGLVRHPF